MEQEILIFHEHIHCINIKWVSV